MSLFLSGRALTRAYSRSLITQSTVSSVRFFSKKPGSFMCVLDKKDPRFQENLAEMKNMENHWLRQIQEAKRKKATEEGRLCVDEICTDLQEIEQRTTNDLQRKVQEVEKKVEHLRDFFLPTPTP